MAAPSPGAIGCWRLEMEPSWLPAMQALLAPSERERAAAYRLPGPRDQFVFFRGAVRAILAATFGLEPGFRMDTGPYGKPRLPDHPRIGFNVSHSRGRGLIACAYGQDLGVDGEHIDDRADVGALAGRVCSRAEREELAASPERIRLFYRLWTRKEAYAKSLGLGLAMPFGDIESDSGEIFLRREGCRTGPLPYFQWEDSDGFAACLVYARSRPLDRFGNRELARALSGPTGP